MAVQIQFRRGTASEWTTADPTLAAGELAIETDTDFYKIGDGSTAWTSLDYSSLPAGSAPLASPTFTGTVTMADLVVNGTTSTINSATLTVDDKNIELGSVASPSDTTADGGGITLKGASDKTFNWVNSTDAWTSSEHIALATGKSIYIDSVLQLSKNALAATVVLADGVAATTQSANDSTTKVATTAFVMTEIGDYLTTSTAASTYAPLASPTFTGTATGDNATFTGTTTTYVDVVQETGTSHTFALSDAGKYIHCTTPSANCTITLPSDATTAFPIGTQMLFSSPHASNKVVFAAGSSAAVTSLDDKLTLHGPDGVAAVLKLTTNSWLLFGPLE